MEEQSAPNKQLHKFPENLLNEEESRWRYKFCGSPIRHVKRFLSSGLLLKGFGLALGLWNPRRRWRACFALIFLLVDVYLSIQTVIYVFVCPSHQVQSWCTKISLNITSQDTKESVFLSFRMKELLLNDVVLDIGRLLSHLTFFWSVWQLSKETSCLKQENTVTLVNPSEWIKLNCVLVFFLCALSSSTIFVVLRIPSSDYASLVAHGVYSLSLWTSLVTCLLFGTLMSSLETLVSRCTHDIITSQHFDDAIKKHQQLCKVVFGLSNVFKVWFIVHWVVYTIACVLWVASFVSYSHMISHSPTLFFYEITLVVYLYVFIYPCYQAAALTRKCQQMLVDFNLMTDEDWQYDHPFQNRSRLHLFLQYASYADCGYRVGRYTFGSMAVFFSTLLAMVGTGSKIL